MSNQKMVQKLWNLCNVLRDDGITYHQYVTELTYILFLKILQETGTEKSIKASIDGLKELQDKRINSSRMTKIEQNALSEKEIVAEYTWEKFITFKGENLKKYYNTILRLFSEHCTGHISSIYHDARSNISEPKNLEKIISNINNLDWYSVDKDGFGDLYEGLLEKNANEKKSGAGQYFTPRVLIDVMVELIKPQIGDRCNDPACGTFGFMIAADRYVKEHNDMLAVSNEQYRFQKYEAFTGCELVPDTYRLALMNAVIHGIESKIECADTLSNKGKGMNGYDVILTNPPFGTKQGGEPIGRKDFTISTSNKQLNFLQHIYHSLKKDDKARAAVILPDNVLFADGDGTNIREELLNKCELHTVLRLPTGIFYAHGVKTNVLFFNSAKKDKNNTQKVWFYDMRTNMPSFGKTTPLKKEHFVDFITAYNAEDRTKIIDGRWNCFTREEIATKNNSLDLGLIRNDSIIDYEDFVEPIENGEETVAQLEEAADLIMSVVKELKSLGRKV